MSRQAKSDTCTILQIIYKGDNSLIKKQLPLNALIAGKHAQKKSFPVTNNDYTFTIL